MNLILSTGHWTSMEFPDSVYIGLVLLLHTNCCIVPYSVASAMRDKTCFGRHYQQRMILWLRCERRGVRGEASEEISFISADCSLAERSLSISSRGSVGTGDSVAPGTVTLMDVI